MFNRSRPKHSFLTFWRNTNYTLGGWVTTCCKFPAPAMDVSLSKIINWLTLGKVIAIIQRVTFLLDHCVLPIVESCLDANAEETTSACKNAEKYAGHGNEN